MHKLIIFDLDGTLAESKQPLSLEMAGLLARLLAATQVAIISGGALPQFLKQVVDRLPPEANLRNLYLLPTSGATLYEYSPSTSIDSAQDKSLGTSADAWKKVYEERLSEADASHIERAMRDAATHTGLIDFSAPAWGERVEYRGSQVTLSALGQKAPVKEKQAWDPDKSKRRALQAALAERLPQFSVRMGGATSIDVTKSGIDKAYGIRKLCERLNIPESEALYIGDQLTEGGNDEAVFKTNVGTKSVNSPSDTARLIEALLESKEV
ncbi:HAD-IIB family hydrolase [Candidatus Kaiserbacteria bacterium]|nr:HAD-IIB family hydrolase [Candidatus Kaiserbacteria bacterium]